MPALNPDIIIPTCKSRAAVAPLVNEVEGYAYPCRVYATCQPVSAAKNRNIGLEWAQTPVVIMLDDDMAGFYPGWHEKLVEPLEDSTTIIVSARLTNTAGINGAMMFLGDVLAQLAYVPRVPTAAMAFRKTRIRFNEEFLGSGFEDDDFCAQMARLYPHGRVAIHNGVRLIHINEQKHQGEHFAHNKALFDSLWMTSDDNTTRTDYTYNIPRIIHNMALRGDTDESVLAREQAIQGRNPEFTVNTVRPGQYLMPSLTNIYDRADTFGQRILHGLSLLHSQGGWVFWPDTQPYPSVMDICRKHDLSCGALVEPLQDAVDMAADYGYSRATEVVAARIGADLVDRALRIVQAIGTMGNHVVTEVLRDAEESGERIAVRWADGR